MAIMLADIAHCRAAGAAGVVVGILRPDGDVDEARTETLVRAARPMRVTFHRAIDAARDPLEAFEASLRLGVDFVLTSGHAPTAPAGADVIAAMVRRARVAASPVVVLAGGGVTAANAEALVRATGVTQLHGTGASGRARACGWLRAGC
jgi:copper homeostasis protein